MESARTVYFGSFFEWTSEGREKLTESFRKHYHDQENVPFVGYNADHHVFFLHTTEPLAVQKFASALDATIRIKQLEGNNVDILSQEWFRQIECTTLPELEDNITYNRFHVDTDLIAVDDDSDHGSTDNTSSGGVPSVYWMPRCGNIGILSNQTATEIATLTECMLYKEPARQRVRIMNGDIHRALQKLQNMEPFLQFTACHNQDLASPINHNLLSFTSKLPGTGIVYFSTTSPAHCDRIIVPAALAERLENLLIGEEYVWDGIQRKHIPSLNIRCTPKSTNLCPRKPSIWKDCKIKPYGDPGNALPRITLTGNVDISAEKVGPTTSNEPRKASSFLPLTDQARMHEWSCNVDDEADPAIPAEEPIDAEPDEEPAIRRRVADSDSEDDEVPGFRAIPLNHEQQIHHLSDRIGPIGSPRRFTFSPKVAEHTAVPSRPAQRLRMINASPDDFWKDMPCDENAPERTILIPNVSNATPVPDTANRNCERREKQQLVIGLDGTVDETDHDEEPFGELPRDRGLSQSIFIGDRDADSSVTLGTSSPPYTPSIGFDPSSYGARRLLPKGQNFRTPRPDHQMISSSKKAQNPDRRPKNDDLRTDHVAHKSHKQSQTPVESWPRPDGSNRETQLLQDGREVAPLIDLSGSSGAQKQSIEPPPGLRYRPNIHDTQPHESHLLDGPLEEIQRPSLKPARNDPALNSKNGSSVSASGSSGLQRQPQFEYLQQTKINRPDVYMMQGSMLQQLMSATILKTEPAVQHPPGQGPTEKIEEHDELSTRQFHRTMNLRAPNPSNRRKGKTPGQNSSRMETAAEKAERIAQAKLEAFGPLPRSKANDHPSKRSSQTQVEIPVSTRKQEAAKMNLNLASMRPDILEEKAGRALAENLVVELKPYFEASRYFVGDLNFELQIGRLLIEPYFRLKEKKIFEIEKWTTIFVKNSTPPKVFFSPIVTNDGADIDGILEIKAKAGRGQKTFDSISVSSQTDFEFQCTDIAGLAFNVLVKTDGSYTVYTGRATVSKVALHCPGRVWDACAILGGIIPWRNLPESLEAAVAELVSTIYIKTEKYITVFYRQPASNVFSVNEVVLRRTSHHQCTNTSEGSLQLKISEIQRLYTNSHRFDKKLHFSTTKSHDTMANDSRLHYELAVVDSTMQQVFNGNNALEMGEAVSRLDVQLLKPERLEKMVDLTLQLVSKMDWVGLSNRGTLVRQHIERQIRVQEIARTLPLTANPNLIRPAELVSGIGVTGTRTTHPSLTDPATGYAASSVDQMVPGVRTGTQARIYVDAQGNRFRFGQGAARIPVPDDDDGIINKTEIRPSDSASQVDRAPARVAKGQMPGHEDKPPGFW